jgi:multidrug resistance efflux pump
VGDYVVAGKPVLALLDTGSFRIDGYFEETRLRGVAPGQSVDIRLMGESAPLRGHGEHRRRHRGPLPQQRQHPAAERDPAFDWVRLAQRIPVRIAIDEVPKGVELIAGRTATVTVDTGRHPHNDKAGTAPTQAGL